MPITRSAAKRLAQNQAESGNCQENASTRPLLPKVLFGLPPELSNMIFNDVSPIDLINFATISTHCKSLAESLRIKVKSIKVRHFRPDNQITHWRGVRKEDSVDIKLANGENISIELSTWDKEQEREFENCKFDMTRSETDSDIYCATDGTTDEMAQKLCRFLFKIYKTEDVTLRVQEPPRCVSSFVPYFVRNVCSQFKDFDFTGRLSDEEYRLLMENISVSGQYKDSVQSCSYEGPLQHKRMVTGLNWKMDNLIGMRCEELELKNGKFSVENLKTFVENWIQGGFSQLERFEFKVEEGSGLKKKVEKALKPLGVTKWAPPLKDFYHIKTEDVLCIREENGRLAFLQARWQSYEILVCHDKFLEEEAEDEEDKLDSDSPDSDSDEE